MTNLEWNNDSQHYEAKAEIDGKVRFIQVDGDVFAESRREVALNYLAEKFPELSREEIKERYENNQGNWAYEQATQDLLSVNEWIGSAPMHGVYVDGEEYV